MNADLFIAALIIASVNPHGKNSTVIYLQLTINLGLVLQSSYKMLVFFSGKHWNKVNSIRGR